ncbi:Lrp/AsnC family transcriptional regulator [Microbispora triticiradicis]|uniref:AsnC family transcriptional regulator n=1 Tax=Microbispora triticiradicis TaxID=2200763 RepID=UPI0014047CAD|nr:Lrp/AsnC family transcriptional regulator [Microbispora triticiradicis]
MTQRYELDAQDQAIVGLLREDGRAPLARIGEQVGLSADAVRARMARLSGDGVLRVIGLVDPAVLGYDVLGIVGLRYRGPVDRLRGALNAIPQVTFAAQTIGAYDVMCEVAARDDADLADVVQRIAGTVEGVGDHEVWRQLDVAKWESQGRPRRSGPPAPRRLELDDLDVALLRLLVDNPRASFREMEDELGVPYWVVRKRAQTLFRDGTIQATAMVDRVSTDPVIMMASVGITLGGSSDAALDAALDALVALPELPIVTLTAGRFHVVAEAACGSARDLAALMRRIVALDGVRDLTVLPYARVLVLPRPWRFGTAAG